jgi:chromosome segregation ATPase
MEDLIIEQQNVREQLESEISQLNEEVYHHSSDVNTMRLKEEEDADVIKQLQTELASVNESLAEANAQLEQKEYFINVDVANKEKDYYDMKKRL